MKLKELRKCIMCKQVDFWILRTSKVKTCSHECSKRYWDSPARKAKTRKYQKEYQKKLKARCGGKIP